MSNDLYTVIQRSPPEVYSCSLQKAAAITKTARGEIHEAIQRNNRFDRWDLEYTVIPLLPRVEPDLSFRLHRWAAAFYTHAESPSEEDMETVFDCLIKREVHRLEAFVRTFGITLED